MNMIVWAKGLLAAVIGGVANSVTMIIADPLNFNLNDGIGNLLTVAGTSAIVAAAAYLAKSPIPEVK